jgi:cytoskeletal protein CcmA (bactofilin family)
VFFRKQKAAVNDNHDAVVATATLIGADTTFEGNLSSDGEVRIEGILRGSVRARSCVVAAQGVVEGDITADDVIVHGQVKGPLRAEHVHLQTGATVEGDITSDTIAIETGARLSGAVWQTSQAEAQKAQPALSYGEGPALFSESLWSSHRDDGFRPLRAVRPRASNGR